MVKSQDDFSMALTDEHMAVSHGAEEMQRRLGIDKASVTVTSTIEFKTRLLSQSDVCWKVHATQLLITTLDKQGLSCILLW